MSMTKMVLSQLEEAKSLAGFSSVPCFLTAQKVHATCLTCVWFVPYFSVSKIETKGFPGGASGKELTCQCRRQNESRVQSLG